MPLKLRSYFSLSGSFSRIELLVATTVLLGIAICLSYMKTAYPDSIATGTYNMIMYSLYPIWGAALGKRSRDLGTTFTYGMIIGMVFPVIGLVFLFQGGKKAQTKTIAEQDVPPNA